MLESRQGALDYFRQVLVTVVGQAYAAAGYTLIDDPVRWAGGKFRFSASLPDDLYGFIDYQTLIYADTDYAARMPSRFRVMLTRSDHPGGGPSDHPQYVQRTLSQLVVTDFGVAILPDADHWWTFHDTDSLGKALAEAGHLAVGYGIPWLAGDLTSDR